jgi:hypothetical protein
MVLSHKRYCGVIPGWFERGAVAWNFWGDLSALKEENEGHGLEWPSLAWKRDIECK